MTRRAEVDGQRLLARLDSFAAIGGTPAGGVNRQALSVEDRTARDKLARLGIARGFKVYQDSMANLFIRREGKAADKAAFLIGSHLDSQPTGGRYDGALGTLAAFEVLEALEDVAFETDLPVEMVAWTNEEGSRFAPGAMGSMAFSSKQIPDEWQTARGTDGVLLKDALADTIASLPIATMRPLGTPVGGYLELHIEQGPTLEHEQIPIGIVNGIQGTRWLDVTISGQAAHAGTTQLAYRRDPMVAATQALQQLYQSVMPKDSRARLTVGRMSAQPGSVNSIPSEVLFTVDVRHPDIDQLEYLDAHIRAVCEQQATEAGCTASVHKSFDMAPSKFSASLLEAIERAAKRLSLAYKHMPSGAFHDALFISRVAPSAMIFVPCRDGLSHNEAEFIEPEQAVTGAQMLLESTLEAMQICSPN